MFGGVPGGVGVAGVGVPGAGGVVAAGGGCTSDWFWASPEIAAYPPAA